MAYVDKPASRLTKVLADIIPSDQQKLKEWLSDRFPTYAKGGVFERPLVLSHLLKFQKDNIYGDFVISVSLPGIGPVLKFTVGSTPACCAMAFMHNFIIVNDPMWPGVNEEELDKILTAAFRDLNQYGMLSSRRVILNMVETGRSGYDPLMVVTPVENPTINYKPFWTYFHKHAAKVNTMLMPNANTGRIIHHMEVLFDPSFFKE